MNLKKAIGFVRRSTCMQDKSLQDKSLQDQKTMISKWVKTAPVIAEEGIDPTISRLVETVKKKNK